MHQQPLLHRYVSLAWVQILMYTSSSPWRHLILQFISQTTYRSDRYWKSYLLRRLFPVSWTIIYSEFSRVLCRLLTELVLYQHSPPHASSWLTVIPSEGQGLHLDPPVFQTALKWWLGLDTAEGSVCALCPDKMLDPLGHHATTCKRGGDVVFRHNRLRDILAETCRRAHFSVQVEAAASLHQITATLVLQMSSFPTGLWGKRQPATYQLPLR